MTSAISSPSTITANPNHLTIDTPLYTDDFRAISEIGAQMREVFKGVRELNVQRNPLANENSIANTNPKLIAGEKVEFPADHLNPQLKAKSFTTDPNQHQYPRLRSFNPQQIETMLKYLSAKPSNEIHEQRVTEAVEAQRKELVKLGLDEQTLKQKLHSYQARLEKDETAHDGDTEHIDFSLKGREEFLDSLKEAKVDSRQHDGVAELLSQRLAEYNTRRKEAGLPELSVKVKDLTPKAITKAFENRIKVVYDMFRHFANIFDKIKQLPRSFYQMEIFFHNFLDKLKNNRQINTNGLFNDRIEALKATLSVPKGIFSTETEDAARSIAKTNLNDTNRYIALRTKTAEDAVLSRHGEGEDYKEIIGINSAQVA